ncbi:hypothetical protein V6N11_001678 [Hibiscus sabdariffa]|uniref:Ubiquinol-cytochrome C reductase hinge domain-containing protein n=1 Tax=Hibiscus sabdariffa TaxID=183260 RepID=A0ABR1ZRC0_9ROSI
MMSQHLQPGSVEGTPLRAPECSKTSSPIGTSDTEPTKLRPFLLEGWISAERGEPRCSRETRMSTFITLSGGQPPADEEPVDQKKTLENICQSGCAKPKHGYEECVKRISGDDTGTKHCTGQYFDYLTCVDKCVAPKLFAKLK